MNNSPKSRFFSAPRIVGILGVASILGLFKYIFGDEFGIALVSILFPVIVIMIVLFLFFCVEWIFTGKWNGKEQDNDQCNS